MSSTNRGGERSNDDVYETPEWVTRLLLGVWRPRSGTFLVEPALGGGAIVRVFRSMGVANPWSCIDVRDCSGNGLVDAPFAQHDFLTLTPAILTSFLFAQHPNPVSVGAVVTNPPFKFAERFLRQARLLYPLADVVLHLRINFLGSDERVDLWPDVGVPDVYVLPNRPSYGLNKLGKKGTDSCEYGWFVFPSGPPRTSGRLAILPRTDKSVRCPPRPKKPPKLKKSKFPKKPRSLKKAVAVVEGASS